MKFVEIALLAAGLFSLPALAAGMWRPVKPKPPPVRPATARRAR